MFKRFKKNFYELDPRYFKDGNNDGKGDLKGLLNNIKYFKYLGVDVLILKKIINVESDDDFQNFTSVFKELGDMNTLVAIIEQAKLFGMKIGIELPIGHIKEKNVWFDIANNGVKSEWTELIHIYNKNEVSEISEDKQHLLKHSGKTDTYFIQDTETKEIPLNWDSDITRKKFKDIILFWNNIGITAFVLKDFEYLCNPLKDKQLTNETIEELHNIYEVINIINEKTFVILKTINKDIDFVNKINLETQFYDYIIFQELSNFSIKEKYRKDAIVKHKISDLVENIRKYSKNYQNIISIGNENYGRINSLIGNSGEYWAEAAKSLALLSTMTPGSPIIISGDEIGTLNIGLKTQDNFDDANLLTRKSKSMSLGLTEEEFYKAQVRQNKINYCSAFSWNANKNAGFSVVDPKINIVHSYKRVNLKNQFQKKQSPFNFFRRLLQITSKGKVARIINTGNFTIKSTFNNVVKIKSTYENQEVITYINLSNKPKFISCHNKPTLLLSTYGIKKYKNIPKKLYPWESIVIINLTKNAWKETRVLENYVKQTKFAKEKEKELLNLNKTTSITLSDKINDIKYKKELIKTEKEANKKNKEEQMFKWKKKDSKTQSISIEVEKKLSTKEQIEKIVLDEADKTKLTESELAATTQIDASNLAEIEKLLKMDKKKKKNS